MPAFRFEAIDAAGRAQKGVIDADSARAARGQLRTQGLTPPAAGSDSERLWAEKNRAVPYDIAAAS